MDVRTAFPLVDEILMSHARELGADAAAYRNHVYRGLNYFAALGVRAADAADASDIPDSVLLAAAFHDLGIWTDGTFDYLVPSTRLAGRYLAASGRAALGPEVSALIAEHHKIRAYRGPFESTVERFRRADLVDVTLGTVHFGLHAAFVRDVKKAFPDSGFHARLIALAAKQFLRTPWRPVPVLHW